MDFFNSKLLYCLYVFGKDGRNDIKQITNQCKERNADQASFGYDGQDVDHTDGGVPHLVNGAKGDTIWQARIHRQEAGG